MEEEESEEEEVKSPSRTPYTKKKRSRSEEEEYSPYNHKKMRPVPDEDEEDEEYLPYEHTLKGDPSSVTSRSEAAAIDAAVKGLLRLSRAAPLAVDLDLVAERLAQFKRRFR